MGCSEFSVAPLGHSLPLVRAVFKQQPDDFQVREQLDFLPGNVGEHLYLQIEKVRMETAQVVQRLAQFYGVQPLDIGYAGLKDRRARARQWFSIRTPSDLAPAATDSMRVVGRGRHGVKLRRGSHLGNQFVVRLRDIAQAASREALVRIAERGAPNYFGPQRFAANSLQRAQRWLRRGQYARRRRFAGQSWHLSVLRSLLFNQVLSHRVAAENWSRLIEGDAAVLCGGASVASGPLWGRGRSPALGKAGELERRAVASHRDICQGLERAGVRHDRRALVLRPEAFSWECRGREITLAFSLPAGGYATSLLREAFVLVEGNT